METTEKDGVNLTQLLLQISTDVASIKMDMSNFKETQRTEREVMIRTIDDVRTDCHKEIAVVSESLGEKITRLQDENARIVKDIVSLKAAEDKKDARKWRAVMAYIATALGGILVAKIPDIIIKSIGK